MIARYLLPVRHTDEHQRQEALEGDDRPYVEFAGGPFYTDLAGQIPEESARFNFILTAGGGVSWFFTPQFSFNVGFRFHHISNAGTRYPNLGLNSGLPFGGFSFYY